MGITELDIAGKQLTIYSHFILYGSGATPQVAALAREEVETMWNEPAGLVSLQKEIYRVSFRITAEIKPEITDLEIYQNTDARNNYFRIEPRVHPGEASMVDGLGSNSGYFLLEHMVPGTTTAAHEYGHTLGLDHPPEMDIRGEGVPGIMYPRGTIVDAPYQWDPNGVPHGPGGTMNPAYRKVVQKDIDGLKLHRLRFVNGQALIGEFTNIYHPYHGSLPHFIPLPIEE